MKLEMEVHDCLFTTGHRMKLWFGNGGREDWGGGGGGWGGPTSTKPDLEWDLVLKERRTFDYAQMAGTSLYIHYLVPSTYLNYVWETSYQTSATAINHVLPITPVHSISILFFFFYT